jgi:hypothetical protein
MRKSILSLFALSGSFFSCHLQAQSMPASTGNMAAALSSYTSAANSGKLSSQMNKNSRSAVFKSGDYSSSSTLKDVSRKSGSTGSSIPQDGLSNLLTQHIAKGYLNIQQLLRALRENDNTVKYRTDKGEILQVILNHDGSIDFSDEKGRKAVMSFNNNNQQTNYTVADVGIITRSK